MEASWALALSSCILVTLPLGVPVFSISEVVVGEKKSNE